MNKQLDNDKLKNVINFYMLANNLKFTNSNNVQSVADRIYGAMILATSVNSEYNKGENLGRILRMILLGGINDYYSNELNDLLKKMGKGASYEVDVCKFNKYDEFESKNGKFAFDCFVNENIMQYFFENVLDEDSRQNKSVEELYKIAKDHDITKYLGNNDEKNYEVFKFYYSNRVLKNKVRSGWDKNHWNVSSNRIERISEHVVGTIALACALYSEFKFKIDIDKVISTLCIHEIGEINIGDITPFDGITPEQKQEIEHKAMEKVIGNLQDRDNMLESLLEFDEKSTKEAKFAYRCDKLEADIQAKVYQDMGYQHSLDDQQNNVVFKSSKINEIIQNGAQTAFDVWYEWDKNIYNNAEEFKKVLKYVKENKLK